MVATLVSATGVQRPRLGLRRPGREIAGLIELCLQMLRLLSTVQLILFVQYIFLLFRVIRVELFHSVFC